MITLDGHGKPQVLKTDTKIVENKELSEGELPTASSTELNVTISCEIAQILSCVNL